MHFSTHCGRLLTLLVMVSCAWSLIAQSKRSGDAPREAGDAASAWLKAMDGDGDGRISNREATGLMKRFFSRNDASGDGFLDGKELRALAERLERNRGGRKSANRRPPTTMSTGSILANAPAGVVIEADIAYRPGKSRAWRLDLVRPKNGGKTRRPGIVFVHGGGWRSGDKRAGTFLRGAIEYAQKGYVCVTVNYRLTGEAPFPASIEDVKCAVRWFRAHGDEYGLDPERIGGYGNSAGAHLVAMLGLAKPAAGLEGDGPWRDQSSLLQAVCASATPTDFKRFRQDYTKDTRFQSDEYEPGELARLCSPITHVRGDGPPFLLVHGTADRTVDVSHSDAFVEALKEAGHTDVTYIRIEKAGHGVFNQHADRTGPAMEKFFARTLSNQAPAERAD